jgi:O-succinylbenzoic acid--CoA ligase
MATLLFDIKKSVEEYPDDVAIIDNGREITNFEMNNIVRQYQLYLLNLGVRVKDVVAISGTNSVKYIAFLLAIWRINAIAFPLDSNIPIIELKNIFRNNFVHFFICNMKKYEKLNAFDITLIDVSMKQIINLDNKINIDKNINKDEIALLVHTSGSSAESKIVALNLSNLYYSAMGVIERFNLLREDRWLLTLPLFHVGGIGVLIRCFISGAKIVIYKKTTSFINSIVDNKITYISLVSTQLYKLIKEIKKNKNIICNMKVILLGGSAIPDNLIKDALEYNLPVFSSYGSSEMSSTVSVKKHSIIIDNKTYSSGCLLNYRDILIDKNNEILLRGETLFKGYLRGKNLTLPLNHNGWFQTGDLGYWDDNNELVITGRKDNMFISGGENIQPEEIERVLLEISDIIESKVLPVDDDKFGFRPIAFIKTIDGNMPDLNLLIEYLSEKLQKFKIPDSFYPWPKNDLSGLKPSKNDFLSIINTFPKF